MFQRVPVKLVFRSQLAVASFLILLIFLVSQSSGSTSGNSCFSTLWPHELSDLAPDPTVRFGKLSNGFRYAIKHNDIPRERVALYLNVQVGSVYEEDSERGYAHYLEHMLFNGSTHFPPGKLVEYFQAIGMNYGADTNAYTTLAETVYTMVLPQADTEEIKKGLLVMSDYARGALLLPSEVERERGVILAEKLTRDSAQYRTHVATTKNALQGTLLAERQPIGIEKTIKAADSPALRTFYDKWYRPENMILVVVGDAEEHVVEDLIRETFNDFSPRTEAPACPEIGRLTPRGLHSFYHHEAAAGSTQVTLESYWNQKPRNDSFALQIENLQDYIATSILQKRLEKIAETEVGLLSNPRVYSGDLLNHIGYAGLSASTSEERWRDLLELLEKTLRQAVVYGITNTELELAKKEVLAYFARQVDRADSRKSTEITRELVHTINENRVFQSPRQEKQLYSAAVSSFTTADIQRSLVKLFDRSERLIEVTGSVKIAADNPEHHILELYEKARLQPLIAYEREEQLEFPYLKPPEESVQPVQYKEYKEIDVHSYTYENGTVLNFKNTDYQKNQVSIEIQFGPGKRGEPLPGMAMLAESVVEASGTATLTGSQFADALAGNSVNYAFNIGTSRFSLTGKALSAEVVTLFDTLYALLRDPGLREEIYYNTLENLEQMYQALQSNVRGAEVLLVQPFLAGGNTLFGMVQFEEVEKIRFSQIQEWILPIFAHSKLEISVVGDVDRELIVDLVGKYFGSLPPGMEVRYKEESVDFPAGERRDFHIGSQLDKVLLAIAWKTQGFTDISSVRRLDMLADVMDEHIRQEVREKLGAAYSSVVYNTSSRFIPDHGMLYVRIITDATRVKEVEEMVLSIGRKLAVEGVTEEDLALVKKPILTSLKDLIRTNGYWLNNVLSGATLYPEQLQWPKNIVEDHAAITAAEISSYARKYLDPAGVAVARVLPVAKPGKN